jgi:CTP-dependent riboflavin kinase
MLIEIPDIEVILSVILAFIVGLGSLYIFFKVRPLIKTPQTEDSSQSERLEYYERQLIDMKIRLDALELQGNEIKSEDQSLELKQFLEKLATTQKVEKEISAEIQPVEIKEPKTDENTLNIDSNDITEQVLHLITDKAMTSRDIQKALKRSREHTSRFMKKLFEEGLVERNTKTKPYTYSITDDGLKRIASIHQSPSAA